MRIKGGTIAFYVCLLLTFFFRGYDCYAGKTAFHHLTVENGLSQNAVIAIGQDSQGFLWIGTPNGLNRYDGYRVKQYQSRSNDTASLTSNSIYAIYTDSRMNMWVATAGGFNRYNSGSDNFTRMHTSGEPSLNYFAVAEDKNGTVWVGGDRGLYQVNQQKTVLQSVPLPSPGNGKKYWEVRAILEDRAGYIWIGTTNGLVRLQNTGSGWQPVFFSHQPADEYSLSSDFISSLAEDRYGRIWISTHNNGLNVYESSTGRFRRMLHKQGAASIINNNIRKILFDRQGRLWVGTQEGVSLLDENGNVTQSFQQDDKDAESLSHNSIHSLFQDDAGSVWIGTYFGGVNYTYAVNTDFAVLRKKDQPGFLNNNVISSITEDDKKNLWIGTEGGGLNYYDRATGLFTNYRHISTDTSSLGSNLVKFVYRDWQGHIWCGTHGGGLNFFDPVRKLFRHYLYNENDPTFINAEVQSIYEDSKGRLWVGSTLGIRLYNKTVQGLEPVTLPFTQKPPFNGTAKYFLEDDKKRLWIASLGGLYLFEKEQARKISDNLVNCIVQDKNSQIWFGLQKEGLASFEEQSQRLIFYNQPGRIYNRNILGILEDNQQNLWLSSDNGLLKFNPRQDHLQTFTTSDGLAGNAFNYNSFFKDGFGEFYFGGFNGITHFFPDKISFNPKPGKMMITGLRLFDTALPYHTSVTMAATDSQDSDGLKLKHDENGITIEFALLNYIKSNKNQYAYKLDGFDKEWIYSGTPSASYANLPSGSFTFYVKGANNDGVWGEPVKLGIRILPPFWYTWWAFCLYALLIAGIVFLVVRYIFLRVMLTKEEGLHQVKLNFFTNVSHEIRTHLTLVMASVEKMQDAADLPGFARQQLLAIRHNSNRLLKLVSELMDFRKAETGHMKLNLNRYDFIPFLEDVYNTFRDISLQRNISTSFIYDGPALALWFDKEQLEKVFFNLLSNAVRFTPDGGNIWMEVYEKTSEITITVTDNGRGIAPEYLPKIFTNFFQADDHGLQNTGYGIGLALAKNIVTLHNGTIIAESKPATDNAPGKTVFTVTLKKGKEHFTGARLPLDISSHTKEGYPQVEALLQSLPAASISNTILIVEDNADIRDIIKEKLAGNYLLFEAEDGVKGLEMAVNEIPDIIISDVMMPHMDGFELCRRLKTDDRTSHIPVILLTAKSTQTDQVGGLENGANLYMTKPFSAKVLELNVKNLLTSRERWRQFFMQQVNNYPMAVPAPIKGKTTEISATEQEFLDKLVKLVEDNLDNPEFGVEMLSRNLAMSAPILYKKVKAVSDMSVNDFIKNIRMNKASQLLQEGRMNVFEVAFAVGYSDRKYFSQEFKKQFGKTPREFLQQLKTE